ncbi:unnamed protein product [Rhizophagus irregularis]|nr:unnamed protein product [Rhizophagus irregularis]
MIILGKKKKNDERSRHDRSSIANKCLTLEKYLLTKFQNFKPPLIVRQFKFGQRTPFYVMEFLEGRIFEDVRLLSLSQEDRYKCWYSAIDTLAKLHSLIIKQLD